MANVTRCHFTFHKLFLPFSFFLWCVCKAWLTDLCVLYCEEPYPSIKGRKQSKHDDLPVKWLTSSRIWPCLQYSAFFKFACLNRRALYCRTNKTNGKFCARANSFSFGLALPCTGKIESGCGSRDYASSSGDIGQACCVRVTIIRLFHSGTRNNCKVPHPSLLSNQSDSSVPMGRGCMDQARSQGLNVFLDIVVMFSARFDWYGLGREWPRAPMPIHRHATRRRAQCQANFIMDPLPPWLFLSQQNNFSVKSYISFA